MDMDWKTRLAEIKAETKRLRAFNDACDACAKRLDALLAEPDPDFFTIEAIECLKSDDEVWEEINKNF